MNTKKLTIFIVGLIVICGMFVATDLRNAGKYGAPPYADDQSDFINPDDYTVSYKNWQRPPGPIKIGLQAGHWKTQEMPDELARLRDSGGGATSGAVTEWETVLKIAEETAEILENEGYEVDILPATIPEDYWADVFVSIHADGNLNPLVSGYKVAASARDRTGLADKLAKSIEDQYGAVTNFSLDPNITINMTRYYAFNSRRYDHAIHPMTPGVIVETGFLTNYYESSVLINNPKLPAQGIADGVIQFINQNNPLE